MDNVTPLPADPLVELLRQRLGGEAEPGSDGAIADPGMALLTRLLTQRQDALEEDLKRRELEDDLHRAEADEDDLARHRDQTEQLRETLDAITADLAVLTRRQDEVAAALGACGACWGEDPACRWCRGRGEPGFARPDPHAFATFVVPVLRLEERLRQRHLDDDRTDSLEGRTA